MVIFVCYSPPYFLVMEHSEIILAKNLQGRLSRHYLWRNTMVKMSHFQDQTSPRAGKPLVLSIFMCCSPQSFLVIRNFKIIFAKNLRKRSFRMYLRIRLVAHPK